MKRQVVIPMASGGGSERGQKLGVLEIKQARQLSDRVVGASRNRVVCRFWLEKVLVIVDTLQLYALLWQLSQPWPWPSRWLQHTRWTNSFNIDVFSFGETGAAMGATSQPFSLWGERRHYWVYALAWSLVPAVSAAALWISSRRWQAQMRIDFLIQRLSWENVLFQIFQVLYLPIGLAVIRLFNCDASGRVSVDPHTFPTCWSLGHSLAFVVITCGLGGFFLVGFPWLLRRRIQLSVFTASDADGNDDHERFLKSKELEFVLCTSDAYVELDMPQYASYRRHAVYSPVETCVVKLVLLAIFSLLRSPPPKTANQGLQGSLFFVVFLLNAWKQTWRPAFRLESTNRVAKMLAWLLVANGAIALLCANGVRNALTVSTAVHASLTFVNVTVLVTTILFLAHSAQQWRKRSQLEVLVSINQLHARDACWPTHPLMQEIISCGPELEEWIAQLQRVRALLLKTALAAPTMKPFRELAALQEQLETSWKTASSRHHLLTDQLYQQVLLLSDYYVDALATTPFKDVSPGGKEDEYDAVFDAFSRRLQHRDDQERLVPVMNRRVLSKLRAARTWSLDNQSTSTPRASLMKLLALQSKIHGESVTAATARDWVDVDGTSVQVVYGETPVCTMDVSKWSDETHVMQFTFEGHHESRLVSMRDLYQHGYRLELVANTSVGDSSGFVQAVRGSNMVNGQAATEEGALDHELRTLPPKPLSQGAVRQLIGLTDTNAAIDTIVNQTL